MQVLRFNTSTSVIVATAKITSMATTQANMVVDTGASLVMLPWKIVRELGIPVNTRNVYRITTASSYETVPTIIIPQITVLGKTIKKVEAVVKDLPPGSPVDGLLGLSFLRHFTLEIDFKKGTLGLE